MFLRSDLAISGQKIQHFSQKVYHSQMFQKQIVKEEKEYRIETENVQIESFKALA